MTILDNNFKLIGVSAVVENTIAIPPCNIPKIRIGIRSLLSNLYFVNRIISSIIDKINAKYAIKYSFLE